MGQKEMEQLFSQYGRIITSRILVDQPAVAAAQVLAVGHRGGAGAGRGGLGDPRAGLVHLRLQPGARGGRERPVAALRALRRRHQRQGHPRLRHQQVQRLRLRHHDQLRGGGHGHRQPQRLPPGRPRAPGVLQDHQAAQGLSRVPAGGRGGLLPPPSGRGEPP
ncbi:hypothetical protein RLOC_00005238 [Lonchura striata]|uniref:Uncharacterized protein n=1 Tax=Lonchura striata TaxID=40157 RepID=A0A218U7E2_9PASE|nr:hypothetical protein RLOC_00005238 [Lonchura striata domestica]